MLTNTGEVIIRLPKGLLFGLEKANKAMPNQPKVNRRIDEMITCLRSKGATGVDEYNQTLTNNANNPTKLEDFLFQGRAALMFLYHRFQVHLQDKPDLQIKLGDDIIGAEVTRFKEKQQDINDEGAMTNATDKFVLIGELTSTEGKEAWKQIADKAIDKAKHDQYFESYPNILVIESESPSLELMAKSAANEYDDEIRRCNDSRLRRLSAIMIVHMTGWTNTKLENIELCKIPQAVSPLSDKLFEALNKIRSG